MTLSCVMDGLQNGVRDVDISVYNCKSICVYICIYVYGSIGTCACICFILKIDFYIFFFCLLFFAFFKILNDCY